VNGKTDEADGHELAYILEFLQQDLDDFLGDKWLMVALFVTDWRHKVRPPLVGRKRSAKPISPTGFPKS
jgi:hypothetical protein